MIQRKPILSHRVSGVSDEIHQAVLNNILSGLDIETEYRLGVRDCLKTLRDEQQLDISDDQISAAVLLDGHNVYAPFTVNIYETQTELAKWDKELKTVLEVAGYRYLLNYNFVQ